MNKKKIINDPVYGFINIPEGLILDIIDHPWFQRLRRIKQLGLTDLVYPGALHTRFHHALGAMHLMNEAILHLRAKGISISEEESEAAMVAILLHDAGHGPFSHALESSLLRDVSHEQVSLMVMDLFNRLFNGKLNLAIRIFKNQYKKKFLSQLVSSQLDVDRMDYLNRDSFFTGVSEGKIGTERILNMLNVVENELVVEEKAIYSIENFLNARRLMYWQVYLHKTTIGAEKMLIKLILRARHLTQKGTLLFGDTIVRKFLKNHYSTTDFTKDPQLILDFLSLDDYRIWNMVHEAGFSNDRVLVELGRMLQDRRLFRIFLSGKKVNDPSAEKVINTISGYYQLKASDAAYLYDEGYMSNAAYITKGLKINVLMKNGHLLDIAEAADLPNIKAMSKIVKKYYRCWPKIVSL